MTSCSPLLSGPLERGSLDSVWNSLALVAAENPLLERELENELVANPQLRTLGGIFLWTVSRRVSGSAEISEILISLMRDSRYSYNEPGRILVGPARTDRPTARTTAGGARTGCTGKLRGTCDRIAGRTIFQIIIWCRTLGGPILN